MPLPESDGVFAFYKIVLNVYSSMLDVRLSFCILVTGNVVIALDSKNL